MRKTSTGDVSTGQVTTSAALVYEEFFVPALFDQWVEPILDAVGAREGDRLLDLGCGTGAVARSALRRVGASGSVIAVDPNAAMLAVASRSAPTLDIRVGVAEQLPVDTCSVDRLTCQFALMFFTDPVAAVGEMRRVLRPNGHMAVTTWAAVKESPGYAEMLRLLVDEIGDWAGEALRAPFGIGTPGELLGVLRAAFQDVEVIRRNGEARFPSIDAWLFTEIRGWTLAERIDDDQFARLRKAASTRLEPFVLTDGSVRFPMPALLATAAA